MPYNMKELLPVLKWLTDRYTSKESSSVSYETAQMLLGAVIYCINETLEQSGELPAGAKLPDAKAVYDQGYQLVIEKVKKANRLYNRILYRFEDYGCRNYKDTILKGIPAFFMRYDPRFCPQDHLLTLDYPTRRQHLYTSTGVDLILEYLTDIDQEKQILKQYAPSEVCNCLNEILPDYEELFLDNICAAVEQFL